MYLTCFEIQIVRTLITNNEKFNNFSTITRLILDPKVSLDRAHQDLNRYLIGKNLWVTHKTIEPIF